MAQNTPSRELDKVIVRLPDGMRDELKRWAILNKRSVNAEIVARLEASLTAGQQHPENGLSPLTESEPDTLLKGLKVLQNTIDDMWAALIKVD